jgi:hypothetical protein
MLRSGQPQGGIGSSGAAPPVVELAATGGVDAPPGPGQRQRASRGRGGRRSGGNNNPPVPVYLPLLHSLVIWLCHCLFYIAHFTNIFRFSKHVQEHFIQYLV